MCCEPPSTANNAASTVEDTMKASAACALKLSFDMTCTMRSNRSLFFAGKAELSAAICLSRLGARSGLRPQCVFIPISALWQGHRASPRNVCNSCGLRPRALATKLQLTHKFAAHVPTPPPPSNSETTILRMLTTPSPQYSTLLDDHKKPSPQTL